MIKASIIGASGYSGAEIVRLLMQHPKAEAKYITSTTYKAQKFSEIYPNATELTELKFSAYSAEEALKQGDVVFVALPHGASMKYVPELLQDKKHKVIDLSGDFRFAEESIYEEWYNTAHLAPELLGKAVYGLPEINRKNIANSNFISNPGCFATGAILAAAPLLSKGLIYEQYIIINSLTGISGAGRMVSDNVHFCSCDENISSYKVGGVHQHIPEIEQELTKLAANEVKISFTPHLIPVSRGIYTTINARLINENTTAELIEIFQNFYEESHFVKILNQGHYPQLKAVAGTNYCHIGMNIDERTGMVIVISALDNLVKGASGQAIQNMNIMFGLDEKIGLTAPGLYP